MSNIKFLNLNIEKNVELLKKILQSNANVYCQYKEQKNAISDAKLIFKFQKNTIVKDKFFLNTVKNQYEKLKKLKNSDNYNEYEIDLYTFCYYSEKKYNREV